MISKITAPLGNTTGNAYQRNGSNKNQRILLGLSLGEVSTVALWVDGEIISCVSEERFTRRKNDESYPKNAIEFILNSNKISANDIEKILIAGLELNATTHLLRTYSSWSIKDQLRMMHKFWYPKLYENKEVNLYSLFEDKTDVDQYPGLGVLKNKLTGYFSKDDWSIYKSFLHNTIAEHLDISVDKILHLDHHTCHAAYAYWGGHVRGEDSLVITADAYGDGLSSTISVLNKNGTLQRVHAVPHDQFTIGRIYRYITLLLGMKPNEHEYKVMGLAPYAREEILKPAFEVFNKTLKIDGLDFRFGEKPIDNYFWFRERLEGLRFDAIAGGLQRFTENILLTYTKNALQRFSKRKLAYSGGVSMNIKANMLIKDIEGLLDISIPPSGSDESLAMGVCYAYASQNGISSKPLANAYLGPEYIISEKLLHRAQNDGYRILDANNSFVANLLNQGHVIGRCCGRMEFGARSLGNRSIIANPKEISTIDKINHKIKNRDFWMPFAPSIIEEDFNKYALNKNDIRSPFMTIGFESTDLARKEIPAALHPSDKTLRPHVVSGKSNPNYHSLLGEFKNVSGISGVLNTSFNLHGEPIVCTPEDAYRVFQLSDIDALLFDEKIILKKMD